jgi:hypothetical protein
MNLQAKLTLGYVLLATAMVAIISAVNLGTEMQQQFDATLERAEILKTVAADQVKSALNRQLKVPLREALRRLTLRQVQARIAGSGIVVRQSPAAGTPLRPGAECHLWCEPGAVPAASPSPGPPAARSAAGGRTR